MPINNNINSLYDHLKKTGFNGSELQFRQMLQDDKKRKVIYDRFGDRFGLGDYSQFSAISRGYKDDTTQGGAVSTIAHAPESVYQQEKDRQIPQAPQAPKQNKAPQVPSNYGMPNELRQNKLYETIDSAPASVRAMAQEEEFKPDPNLSEEEQLDARERYFSEKLNKRYKELDEADKKATAGMNPMQLGYYYQYRGNMSQHDPELRKYSAALKQIKDARESRAIEKERGNNLGVWRGMKHAATDLDTWMPTENLKALTPIKGLVEKYENDPQSLTKDEMEILNTVALSQDIQGRVSQGATTAEKIGAGAVESIPFMAEMAISPISGSGRAAEKAVGKKLIKEGVKKTTQKLVRGTTRVGADILAGGAMAATTGLPKVTEGALQRELGDIQSTTDKDGNVVYGGRANAEDSAKAWLKSFGDQTIENHSEFVGEYFGAINPLLTKVAKKIPDKGLAGSISKFLRNLKHSPAYRMVGRAADRTQFHGIPGEFNEEIIGGIENALIVGDQTLDTADDTGVFNPENLLVTLGTVSLTQGVFTGANLGGYMGMRHQANKAIREADTKGQEVFGAERWADIKAQREGIDLPDAGLLLSLQLQECDAPEEREAVLYYHKSEAFKRGVESAQSHPLSENAREYDAVNGSYRQGLETENTEIKREIVSNYTQAMDSATEQQVQEAIDYMTLGNPEASEETRSLARTIAAYQGVLDNNEARLWTTMDEVGKEVDRITYSSGEDSTVNGYLLPVRYKTDEDVITVDRSQGDVYYVTGGMDAYGTDPTAMQDGDVLDVSDDSPITIYNPSTGKTEMVLPSSLEMAGTPVHAQEYKAEQQEQARSLYLQQLDDELGEPVEQAELPAADQEVQYAEDQQAGTAPTTADIKTYNTGDIIDLHDGSTAEVIESTDDGYLVAITGEDGSARVEEVPKDQLPDMERRETAEQAQDEQATQAGADETPTSEPTEMDLLEQTYGKEFTETLPTDKDGAIDEGKLNAHQSLRILAHRYGVDEAIKAAKQAEQKATARYEKAKKASDNDLMNLKRRRDVTDAARELKGIQDTIQELEVKKNDLAEEKKRAEEQREQERWNSLTPEEQQAELDAKARAEEEKAEIERKARQKEIEAEELRKEKEAQRVAAISDGAEVIQGNNRTAAGESQEADTRSRGYELSDEVDPNGYHFVKASDGTTVFGEIRPETGLTPAPIKLSEGVHNPVTGKGYGLLHFEARHGEELRNAGYKSATEFVETVAKNYSVIKKGRSRGSQDTYLIEVQDDKNNTLFIELIGDGSAWTVNSGGRFKSSYSKGKEIVWSLPTVGSNISTGSTEFSATNNSESAMSGNSPQTTSSEDKGSEKSRSKQQESAIQSFIDKWEELKANGTKEEIAHFAGTIRLGMHLYSHRRDVVESLESLYKEVNDYYPVWKEKQVKKFRQKAKDLEKEYGVKIRLHISPASIESKKVLTALREGEFVQGWFDVNAQTVHAYLPNNVDESDLTATYLHEVIAHYGLAKLLTSEQKADFLNNIWDGLDEATRKEFLEYSNGDKMVAAEEWVARFAESGAFLKPENKNLWDRIVDAFSKLLESIGLGDPGRGYSERLATAYLQYSAENLRRLKESNEAKQQDESLNDSANEKASSKENEEASSKEVSNTDRIEDYGEKFGGAAKDLYKEAMVSFHREVGVDDLKANSLSKVFPRPKLGELVKDGSVSQANACLVEALYNEIGNKPRTRRVVGWAKSAKETRDLIVEILDNPLKDWSNDARISKSAHNDAKLLKALNFPANDVNIKGVKVSNYVDTHRGINDYMVTGFNGAYGYASFQTYDEAVAFVAKKLEEKKQEKSQEKRIKKSGGDRIPERKDFKVGQYGQGDFVVYYYDPYTKTKIQIRRDFKTAEEAFEYVESNIDSLIEKYTNTPSIVLATNPKNKSIAVYISKPKNKSRSVLIKDGFKNWGDARLWVQENFDDLKEKAKGLEGKLNESWEARERVGVDHRQGVDVDAASFVNDFGFRGVEFGNWVNQKERQEALNSAYDGLMDLCELIGVSPKALSLNGRLGLAFGSRGRSKAMAHFEPDKKVINLTKMKGSGSLAHEWLHALDNYFSGEELKFASDGRFSDEVRKEMQDAWNRLTEAISKSNMAERAKSLDTWKNKVYWGTRIELAARAFQGWVKDRIERNGGVSDYLNNYSKGGDDFFNEKFYPYPLNSEDMNAVYDAFDHLFDTMEERIDEETGNVVLFRRSLDGANSKQKQVGGTQVDLDDDVLFRLTKRGKSNVEGWLKKREDLTNEEREAFMQYLEPMDNNLAVATGWWYAKGVIRVPEDQSKVDDAVEVAKRAKVDPMRYGSPMEVLDTFKEYKIKGEAIDPESVPQLSGGRNVGDVSYGIRVYDVEDSKAGQQAMREIINTHWGEDANPWCLLQGDGKGNLSSDAWEYWNHYNGVPKRVAFKDGRLLSFCANDESNDCWWDRGDKPHNGIPVTTKMPNDELGRTATYEMSSYGKLGNPTNVHRGDKQNGLYEEWYGNGQLIKLRTNYKNGNLDGLYESYYDNGQLESRTTYKNNEEHGLSVVYYKNGQLRERFNYKNGKPDGLAKGYHSNGRLAHQSNWKNGNEDGLSESYYESGQLRERSNYKNGKQDGLYLSYYENGQLSVRVNYKDGKKDGLYESYHSNGQLSQRTNYKDGEKNGLIEWYYENGKLLERSHLKDGEKNGLVERYYENGNLYARSNYKDGVRDGLYEAYSEGGRLLFREVYKDGLLLENDNDSEGVLFRTQQQEEMGAIKERASAEGTLMKAPNGKPTKLSESQWLQVRTKAFKKWFGDWEKPFRIKKLKNSEDSIIAGDEVLPNDDIKIYKKNALQYGKRLRDFYKNKDTGAKIALTKSGIQEVLNHDYKNKEQLQSIAAIPQIIEKSIYIDTWDNEDRAKNPDVKLYHYYIGGLRIGDVDYTARMVVAERNNGEQFYDHKLSRIEKTKLLDSLSLITTQGFSQEANEVGSPLSDVKDTKLLSILKTDYSKVVDENGEPLVMYHGTPNKDFFKFDIDKPSLNGRGEGQGFYFIADYDIAKKYAGRYGRVIPAFLNVRRFWSGFDSLSPGEKKIYLSELNDEKAYDKLGIDAFHVGGQLIVRRPNQIKSATDNVGAFDSDNEDIRFRKKLNEVNTQFNKELQQQIDGTLEGGHVYQLGMPSDVLRSAGVPNLPIEVTARTLRRKSEASWHKFDLSAVKDLPRAIQMPIMVFDSRTVRGSKVILTELKKGDHNFVVVLKVSEGLDSMLVNDIKSIYPKDHRQGVVDWINSGKLLRYADKEKALDWLNSQHSYRTGTETPIKGFVSATKLVKDFENPKLPQTDEDDVLFRVGKPIDRLSQEQLSKVTKMVINDSAVRPSAIKYIRNNHFDVQRGINSYLSDFVSKDELDNKEIKEWQKISKMIDSTIGDNRMTEEEKAYALWNSTTEKDKGAIGKAEDILMRKRLGLNTPIQRENPMDLGVRHYEEATKKNFLNEMEEAYVDYARSIKALQDGVIISSGKKLKQFEDVYTYENTVSSRTMVDQEDFMRNKVTPLGQVLQEVMSKTVDDTKVDKDLLEQYLISKHGIERNRRMSEEAQKNGDTVRADYSGLSSFYELPTIENGGELSLEAQAQAFVDKFEESVGKDLTDLMWSKINDMTNYSLEKAYATGLISKETCEEIKGMYEHYIPLRGWDEDNAEDYYEYLSRGGNGNQAQQVLKKAKGRSSRARSPLETAIKMAESTIIQGNKNLMKQRLLALAQNHPSALLSVSSSWVSVAPDGKMVRLEPNLTDGMTAEEQAQEITRFEERMEELSKDKDSNIHKFTDKQRKVSVSGALAELNEHAVRVKRNGREYVVWVNGNPKAAQAINGLLNVHSNMSKSMEQIARLNRMVASNLTARNPGFILRNLARDVQSATTVSFTKYGTKYTFDFQKRIARNIDLTNKDGIFNLYKLYENDKLDPNNQVHKWFKEFIKEGGQTGYTQIYSLKDYEKKMQNMLNNGLWEQTAVKVGEQAVGLLEFVNTGIENATRFSAYCASRNMGRTVMESIEDAKEVSVNFNRKGSGAYANDLVRSAYIFVNPSIQALSLLVKTYKINPKRFIIAKSGWFAFGFVSSMAGRMLTGLVGGGDDDDDTPIYDRLSDWMRMNNLILPFKDGAITIPMPHEDRVLYGAGVATADYLLGKITGKELARRIVGQTMQIAPLEVMEEISDELMNNPHPNAESTLKAAAKGVVPTVLRPITDVLVFDNKDFLGRPITGRNKYNEQMPEYTKGLRSTHPFFVNLSKVVNDVWREEGQVKGVLDTPLTNPALMEYATGQYLGGMYQFPSEVYKTTKGLFGNEQYRDWRNVPILNSFYKDLSTVDNKFRETSDRYRYYKDIYDNMEQNYKMAEKLNDEKKINELIELRDNTPWLGIMYITKKDINKMEKNYYDLRNTNAPKEDIEAAGKVLFNAKKNVVQQIENIENR